MCGKNFGIVQQCMIQHKCGPSVLENKIIGDVTLLTKHEIKSIRPKSPLKIYGKQSFASKSVNTFLSNGAPDLNSIKEMSQLQTLSSPKCPILELGEFPFLITY